MKTNGLDKGFSLVELMVALAILAVGMGAVGLMLLSSFQSDRHNRSVRSSDSILRFFAEEFSAGNLGNLENTGSSALATTGTAVVRGKTVVTDADTNPGTYYCKWTSTTYTATSTLRQIDVVVGWGKSKNSSTPCDRDNVEQCPHVMRMTNFY